MILIYEGFQVKPHKQNPASYVVVTDGKGGSIPSTLEGLFTSTSIAKRAIDNYLVNKEEPSGNKSNKKVSESRV